MFETHPEVASLWMGNVDPTDVRTPEHFSVKARLECWWWCGNDSHGWFPAQPGQHLYGFSCPHCRDERWVEHRRILSLPVYEVPELVAAWRDERSYDGLTVSDLGGVAGPKYALRCPEGHKIDTVGTIFVTDGCPWCRANETRKTTVSKSLRESDPELAAIWHPVRNGDLTPENTPGTYRKPLWWKSVQCCGHEWQEPIRERELGRRPQAGRGHYYCPKCESVFGSLAWLDPELAAEWHEDNKLTPWHVKPFSGGVVAKWRCAANPEHVWDAAVIDRSAGRLCPHCSTAGTSQIEKAFRSAAQAIDPDADADRIDRWKVDVLVPSVRLVIEYDGEYWHRDKQDLDLRKTRDLIRAGYKVARIRENDLPNLDIEGSRVRQVSFRPSFGRIDETVQDLIRWASGG